MPEARSLYKMEIKQYLVIIERKSQSKIYFLLTSMPSSRILLNDGLPLPTESDQEWITTLLMIEILLDKHRGTNKHKNSPNIDQTLVTIKKMMISVSNIGFILRWRTFTVFIKI
jgi:hypothetical protein